MKIIFLILLIQLFQIDYAYSQSEGFEKELCVFSDQNASGLIIGGKEHNNSIYANFQVDCSISNESCFTEFHKYNTNGDLIWTYKLDSLLASFKCFTIQDDRIYILARQQFPTNDKYFELVTLDTLGALIQEQDIPLSVDFYENQVVTNLNQINDLFYITGFGFDPNKDRFLGYVRVLNDLGEDIYLRQWDQFHLGYERTVILDIFKKKNEDSLVYFTVTEDKGPIANYLPTVRYCLYSLNIEDDLIDTIFHTNNQQSRAGRRSLIDFNSLGNTVYFDYSSETIISNGIEVGEIQSGYIDYDGAIWISRIIDDDFEEEYNILAFSYDAVDILVSRNDDTYVSGVLDWSRFDEEIWWNSTCFISKFSSTGEFLWQKIYVEIGDGVTNNKSQYINSLMEMIDGSLIGVGESSEFFIDSINRKGWMIKINEHGCLDGTEDCPLINFLDTTTTNQDFEFESFSLKVSPNPTQNNFEVQFGEAVSGTLKLYNLRGVFIEEFDIKNSIHFQISTNGLKSGAYSLIFFSENNPASIKSTSIMISN